MLEGRVSDCAAGPIPRVPGTNQGSAAASARRTCTLQAAEPPARLAEFVVEAPESKEIRDLSTNWDLMHNLAVRTGGQVFSAEARCE